MFGHQFGGIFARDTLPLVLRKGRRGYLVNTDCILGENCGKGVHWIAVMDLDGQRLMSVLFGDPWVAVAQEVRSHEICISRSDNHGRCT